MLVVLKIPIVYLCAVVWWAIRAEPHGLEAAGVAARLGPRPDCDWRMHRVRRPRRPVPRGGGPLRRPGRVAYTRSRVSA